MRAAMLRVHPRRRLEEQAVCGHGVKQPRGAEDRGRVAAERGDDDGEGHDRGAGGADERRRGAFGDARGPGQFVDRKRDEIGDVDREIHGDDGQQAKRQCPREIARRITDFAGRIRQKVETVVGPEHGNHRDAEGDQGRAEIGWHDRRPRRCDSRRGQREDRQEHQPGNLRNRQHAVRAGPETDAKIVDAAKQNDRSHGDKLPGREAPGPITNPHRDQHVGV